jgi:hypothetical protein
VILDCAVDLDPFIAHELYVGSWNPRCGVEADKQMAQSGRNTRIRREQPQRGKLILDRSLILRDDFWTYRGRQIGRSEQLQVEVGY